MSPVSLALVLLAVGTAHSSLLSSLKSAVAARGSTELFEGDMRLPSTFNPKRRNAVVNQGLLWPSGVVAYTIDSSFTESEQIMLKSAMRTVEQAAAVDGKSCVRFTPRSVHSNYVHIQNSNGCWSDVGRQGTGKQIIALGGNCNSKGTVMHELLHSLGFYHEQSRADRDQYITIHLDNVKNGTERNFQKYAIGSMVDHLDQPYDYDSIMHYGPYSFARDSSKPTITAKISGATIGQRDHLSVIDIKMIQKLYGCSSDDSTVVVNGAAATCEDRLPNCYLYGEHACKTNPTWAKRNCALTCNICQPVCADKISDCPAYGGSSVCTGYPQWAGENCAKYCHLGTCQTLNEEKDDSSACADEIDDCSVYTKSVCATHTGWATEKCSKFCGFCKQQGKSSRYGTQVQSTTLAVTSLPRTTPTTHHPTSTLPTTTRISTTLRTTTWSTTTHPTTRQPTTTQRTTSLLPTTPSIVSHSTTQSLQSTRQACKDKISICSVYTSAACTSFKPFMTERCPKFCGFCKPVIADNVPCADAIADCLSYSKDVCTSHPDWSRVNCPRFCGDCKVQPSETSHPKTTTTATTRPTTATTTPKSACVDLKDNCSAFGKSQCGGIFTIYMKKHCPKFCSYC